MNYVIGHSLLQWFVISSLKCLFYFLWMSMNQPCFFSKHPDLLGKKNHLRYTWLTPFCHQVCCEGLDRSTTPTGFVFVEPWDDASRGAGVVLLPSNFFWSRRGVGGFLKRNGVDDFGILGMKTWKKPFFFWFVRRSLNLIWFFLVIWRFCGSYGGDILSCFYNCVGDVGNLQGFCTCLLLEVLTSFWWAVVHTNPYLTWVKAWYDIS